jgi:hypothetical protein
MTINEALAAKRLLAGRASELQRLRMDSSVRRRNVWENREEVVEPLYDPSIVDAKLTKIELAIFRIDAQIKQKNAVVEIDVEVDVEDLLAPIPPKG